MSDFPLLRLDPILLIIINILENFNFFDIFNLSLCSSRALRCVKRFVDARLKPNYVHIHFENDPELSLYNSLFSLDSGYRFYCNTLINGSKSGNRLSSGELNGVPYLYNIPRFRLDNNTTPKMFLFWNDKQQGIQELLKHFLKLFGTAKFSFTIDICYKHFSASSEVINLLSSQGYSLWSVILTKGPKGDGTKRKRVDRVKWILSVNCKNIEMQEGIFTNKDINRFLKGWIEGACPGLTKVNFGKIKPDFSVIQNGIMSSANEPKKDRMGEKVSFNICRFDLTIAKITVWYPDNDRNAKKDLKMEVKS